MSFTSPIFFACVAAVAGLFYALPSKWRCGYLLTVSYFFYAGYSPQYLIWLILATLLIYAAGLALEGAFSGRIRRAVLLAGIVPLIRFLVFFKIEGKAGGWLMPLGISYYTFKLVGYLLDVYWRRSKAQRNFIDFALFPAFAAQIVSGPIQRAESFFAQIAPLKNGKIDFGQIEDGFKFILGGLMLKLLVGDRLDGFINSVDVTPEKFSWHVLAITALCYTLQLYADFAGYTNIAIGIAKVFGIDSPPNFNAPFAATNIQEFWRRWHMTLSSFMRDYVYIPLGGNRAGRARQMGNVSIVMALIGLWHGVAWTFLIFGLLHGLFISVTALTSKMRGRFFVKYPLASLPGKIAGIALTFLMMTLSLIFFRADSMHGAMLHVKLLAQVIPCGSYTLANIPAQILDPLYPCMLIAFYCGAGLPGTRFVTAAIRSFAPNWVVYGLGLLMLSALTIESGSKFIYGQF